MDSLAVKNWTDNREEHTSNLDQCMRDPALHEDDASLNYSPSQAAHRHCHRALLAH